MPAAVLVSALATIQHRQQIRRRQRQPHCLTVRAFFVVLVISGRCHRLKSTWGTADEQGPVVLFGLKAGEPKTGGFSASSAVQLPVGTC